MGPLFYPRRRCYVRVMDGLPDDIGKLLDQLHPLQPGVALAVGVLLLGWGGSLWRFTQVSSGLLVGGAVGWSIGLATGNPLAGLVAAAVLGVACAILFYLVERTAVAGLGGVAGVVAMQVGWPLANHGAEASWLLQGGAGLVGMALAGLLHERAVQTVTAIAGAALVALAVGEPAHPWIVGTLAVLGAVFQYTRGAGGGGGSRTRPKPKKK